ncbi:MAG TPA: hypothetical protein EYP33_04210 [Pyrodictium sp.]|nr:hypothetical protein [Pyrodictium sp.]
MPRPIIFFISIAIVLALAATARAESGGITVIPLAVRDSGYDFVQCQHVKVSVKAKYYDGIGGGLFQPAEVTIGPLTARIDARGSYLGLATEVYVKVDVGGQRVVDETIDTIWVGVGSYDYGLIVDCTWEQDDIVCSVVAERLGTVWSGQIEPSRYGYYDIYWDYADTPSIDSEYVCQPPDPPSGVNPAPTTPTNTDNTARSHDNTNDMLLYAVAGLGALALFAVLARPGGSVVVVGGSKRGMAQLVGIALLLAFVGGAIAAWKLRGLLDGGQSNTTLIAVAALGLLLVFLLLSSRKPQHSRGGREMR